MDDPDNVVRVTQARQLAASGNNAIAFNHYCKILTTYNGLHDVLEYEFRDVLTRLNKYLAASAKMAEIFGNFEKALDIYPLNIHLHNDLGLYLYDYGYYVEACCHFQKALKLDPGNVAAEKNLNSVKNFLVERWHFRMLNDCVRNTAYHTAIKETVIRLKDTVLDLGTGTGILAIYASKCSAAAVTGIEASPTMADIAQIIMQENDICPVLIVNKMSTEADYKDIGGKRSLIITELFDAGLFGEHILKSIMHARTHLMSKAGRVLPRKAEFFIAGANCNSLYQRYQITHAAKQLIDMQNYLIHVSIEGTYDCDDVHMYKDLTYLTKPASLLKIDFNDDIDIRRKQDAVDLYRTLLNIIKSGDLNCIIGWFDLDLSKSASLTTNPTCPDRANAWQQAIFFDFAPQIVRENDSVPIEFTLQNSRLGLNLSYASDIIRVSPEIIRFLNDTTYIEKVTSSMGTVCIYLGQITEMSQITMVDLEPFPIFGFLMMKRGAHSLVCYAQTLTDMDFIEQVFQQNNIDMENVKILIGEGLQHAAFKNQKYHALFYNILEVCGDINTRQKDIADHLKRGHLVPGGLILPYKVNLMGQLVYSKWLDINNRVDDENVGDYKVAQFINKYQVSQNIHLSFDNLTYTELSDPVIVGEVSDAIPPDVITVEAKADGDVNAILCWYTIEMLEQTPLISTKRADSYIDGMAFLADPKISVASGTAAEILRCVDPDGAFKLVFDSE